MTILTAIAVTARVMLILLTCALIIGRWRQLWAVLSKQAGWPTHLSEFIVVSMAIGGSVISAVNIFPDAGWHIPNALRLAVVDVGLVLFCIALLTHVYRTARKSGPDKARKAMLCGCGMCVPAAGFVVLLTMGGG
ncbi:hypothetical protein [Croceicoccus sp. YJ47]|uniref:hypothetical protein n=1 Tax=Croceicoccus sp. YJ47 TaxID=2798724 RepID=UPI001923D30D|nr:hypothetical protein [Croceicoccus sp. YJ47]QQN73963.1 hypothetical protein JD971_14635 [Croceicoccus sp. YJ47]